MSRLGKFMTHCINGHEFTPENELWNARGRRECKKCKLIRRDFPGNRTVSVEFEPLNKYDVFEIRDELAEFLRESAKLWFESRGHEIVKEIPETK